MKKILLATLAALTLSAPAFAGNKIMQAVESTVVDSHGNPISTKDSLTVSAATQTDAAAETTQKAIADEPTKKAKAANKGKKAAAKKGKKNKRGHKAKHAVAAPSEPVMAEPLIRTKNVQKR